MATRLWLPHAFKETARQRLALRTPPDLAEDLEFVNYVAMGLGIEDMTRPTLVYTTNLDVHVSGQIVTAFTMLGLLGTGPGLVATPYAVMEVTGILVGSKTNSTTANPVFSPNGSIGTSYAISNGIGASGGILGPGQPCPLPFRLNQISGIGLTQGAAGDTSVGFTVFYHSFVDAHVPLGI